MPPFRVAIIGSGLSGSLLANGLVREAIDCTVYERSARAEPREGYQIRLGDGALTGMRACLTKEHMQRIVQRFGKVAEMESDAPVIYDTNFKELLNLSKIPNYAKSAPINRAVLRDLLREPLYEAGSLVYDKQFVAYSAEERVGRERIRVHFADGTEDECDILIGADGNTSKINRQLGLSNIERLDTHITTLTKCSLPEAARERLDPGLLKGAVGTFSHNKGFFFCVYESGVPDRGDNSSEEASCMLGLAFPAADMPEDFEKMPNDKQWDVMAEALQDWSLEHRSALELLRGQDLYVVRPRVGHRPRKNWRQEAAGKGEKGAGHPQVWLIGDAIHPMLPNRGQGGNTAMHDAADALPRLVRLAKQVESGTFPSRDEMTATCEEYESVMIPRAFEWVKKSGGTKLMAFDSSRMLDWAAMTSLSYVMPLLSFGNAAWGMVFSTKAQASDELDGK